MDLGPKRLERLGSEIGFWFPCSRRPAQRPLPGPSLFSRSLCRTVPLQGLSSKSRSGAILASRLSRSGLCPVRETELGFALFLKPACDLVEVFTRANIP